MTSGCIFKNDAPTQVLRKVHILTKFDLCYTMEENVKIRKMQISLILYSVYLLAKLCDTFDEAFLLTSVYIRCNEDLRAIISRIT